MRAYYNEIDPYAAQWLRNLIDAGHITAGDVDERSIRDVQPGDLAGYDQCHFFAGIGGWSYALRLAGWPGDRAVWTGSCPCQPFSRAGRGAGFKDNRHLWPEWRRLIGELRPAIIFGEQVADAAAWVRAVRGDLEALGYAVGAVPIEAASAGARQFRDRLWFLACADGLGSQPGMLRRSYQAAQERARAPIARHGRWAAEPDVGRVAHGFPGRVDQIRALGNAIVPQVAAEFIGAYLDLNP